MADQNRSLRAGAEAEKPGLYDRIFRPKVYTLPNGKQSCERASRLPLILLLLLLMTVVSVKLTGFSFLVLKEDGHKFFDILVAMFPPDVNYLGKVWDPLFDTIKMSLLGSFVGAVLCVPFAVLASSNLVKNRVVLAASKVFLSVLRTLPTLVTALIATYIFGLGTLAGTTAIAIFTFAYIGKQLYELLDTVDMGAYEACEAMGLSKPRALWRSIMPQVLPTYLSTSLYCFEGNVRYAAILGYVGAGGLGLILNEKIGWREYSSVGMILIVLFCAVVLIEYISHFIRSRLT